MSPGADRVLSEATSWVYVPPEARTVERPEFVLVAYPDHFSFPTMAARWAPGYADVDAVLADARSLGRDTVWFIDVSGGPLEDALRARGAEVAEVLSVLALDLEHGVPDLDVPAEVQVRPVASLDDMRAVERIEVEAFGGRLRDDAELAASDWSKHLVAVREGTVVGVAGLTVTTPTVRLWGSAVAPAARRTGAYRALLQHRLRAGADAGCTMALVKGRVDTSAPVLTRAGFASYGEVRAYRLRA